MPGSNECALRHCFSRYGSMEEDIHLFRFPKDIERSKKWAIACGQLPLFECKMSCGELLHNSYYRICSLHFEDKMFVGVRKKRLHEDAIPTLLLYKNRSDSEPLNHFAGSCSMQNEDLIFNTLLTVNSSNECEQFSIKQEVDPLSLDAVIKIEPQDITSEIETQEGDDRIFEYVDVKQEIEPISHCIASIETASEMEDTSLDKLLEGYKKISQDEHKSSKEDESNVSLISAEDISSDKLLEGYKRISQDEHKSSKEDESNVSLISAEDTSLDKLLEDYKKISQDEHKNSEEDESNVSLISESYKTSGGYLDERKYLHVSDNIGESEQKFTEYNNTFNEHNYARNICEQIEDRHLNCDIYNNSFIYRQNLNTDDTPFTCNMCSDRITQLSLIYAEHSYHIDNKVLVSNVCKETRYQLDEMHTHTCEEPLKCNSCNASFSQRSPSSVHKRTHSDKKLYTCSFCNKSFPRNQYIKHNVHTGEKPFECEMCKKSFSQSANLAKHKRTHTGERPFTCDICSKSFLFFDNHAISVHTRTHTGEKPFTCNICNKSFALKTNLSAHIRTHTGEKPFTCDICKRSFTKKLYFIKHVCITCDTCKRSFTKKRYFSSHLCRQIRKFV